MPERPKATFHALRRPQLMDTMRGDRTGRAVSSIATAPSYLAVQTEFNFATAFQ